MTDPLDRLFACLTCNTTFPLGRWRLIDGRGPFCPNCKSADIHPAHGNPIELNEYLGEIGTKN